MPKCKGANCNAPVIYVETASGQKMILDEIPDSSGNIVIEKLEGLFGPEGKEIARVLKDAELTIPDPARVLYKAHWATCPDWAAFRQRQAGARG